MDDIRKGFCVEYSSVPNLPQVDITDDINRTITGGQVPMELDWGRRSD